MKRTKCEVFNGCNCETCLETSLQLNINKFNLNKLKKKTNENN